MAPSENHGFRLAVLVEGGLALLAAFLAWLFHVPLREQLAGDALQATLRGIVATLPMLAAFWMLMHVRWKSAQTLREQVGQLVSELFRKAGPAQFALIAVLAGVGEELLFRGVLQSLLVTWTGPVAGIAMAAVIFGLFHALSRLYFVLATIVGIYFGWLAFHFGDLIAPIVAHSLYDFIALVYLSRQVAPRTITGGTP